MPVIQARRQWVRKCCLGLAVCLSLGVTQAIAQSATACDKEFQRPLGLTLNSQAETPLVQSICTAGSLERINTTVGIGASQQIDLELRQSAFAESIYHVEIRDQNRAPVTWIQAAPSAGELDDADTASIRLTIAPPADLVSTIQTVTLNLVIHNGLQSWSRNLALQVTVADEQPLFRDQFDIAPIIGQFSQHTTRHKLHLVSAQLPAGD